MGRTSAMKVWQLGMQAERNEANADWKRDGLVSTMEVYRAVYGHMSRAGGLARRLRRVGRRRKRGCRTVTRPFTGVLRVLRTFDLAHNYYSEINLHVTWHTKDSLPLLTPTVEPLVHRYIKQRLVNEKAYIHEIGGIETHIHLVVSSRQQSHSDWIGQLKGASAHEINQQSASATRRSSGRPAMVW